MHYSKFWYYNCQRVWRGQFGKTLTMALELLKRLTRKTDCESLGGGVHERYYIDESCCNSWIGQGRLTYPYNWQVSTDALFCNFRAHNFTFVPILNYDNVPTATPVKTVHHRLGDPHLIWSLKKFQRKKEREKAGQ